MNSIRTITALLALSLLAIDAPAQRALNGPAAGVSPASLTEAYPQNLWPEVGGVATVYYQIDAALDPAATPAIRPAAARRACRLPHPRAMDFILPASC